MNELYELIANILSNPMTAPWAWPLYLLALWKLVIEPIYKGHKKGKADNAAREASSTLTDPENPIGVLLVRTYNACKSGLPKRLMGLASKFDTLEEFLGDVAITRFHEPWLITLEAAYGLTNKPFAMDELLINVGGGKGRWVLTTHALYVLPRKGAIKQGFVVPLETIIDFKPIEKGHASDWFQVVTKHHGEFEIWYAPVIGKFHKIQLAAQEYKQGGLS